MAGKGGGKKWWIVQPTIGREPEPAPEPEPEPVPEPEPEPTVPTSKPKRAARKAKPPAENEAAPETAKEIPPMTPDVAPKTRRGKRSSDEEQAIDKHVGERVRLRRTLMGLSQEKLGALLGLTFQQVQKYERGANRISASKLWRMSEVLEVPVSFFFDGLREGELRAPESFATREVLEHVRRYTAIPEGERKSIRELTKAVAAAHGVTEE